MSTLFRVSQEMGENLLGNRFLTCPDKCLGALDFHHVDPVQKDFAISDSNIYKDINKLKEEVDKCMLVCANCHRELHYNE